MDIKKVVEVLKSLDGNDYCEDYVTDIYRVSFPYERMDESRRMLLVVSAEELNLVELSADEHTMDEETYRLSMTDGYEGMAKLVCHFGLDISDKDLILDRLFEVVADLVERDGNVAKITSLLKELDINYTESN